MSAARLTYLFDAYFNKTATLSERQEFLELVRQAKYDEQVKTLLSQTWENFNSQSQVFNESKGEQVLTSILQRAAANKSAQIIVFNRPLQWQRIAAVAAIIFFAVTSIYIWLIPPQSRQHIAKSKRTYKDAKNSILPGSDKAVLTLSDGSTIVLDSSIRGALPKQGSAKVMRLNMATLAYNLGDENSKEIVYNTLSTPRGGQYQLILHDGTKVWLNASSSIRFPTTFYEGKRNVTITGEAYFEVAKNAAMPFKITVKGMEVQVLGTRFNIMAYDDENSINTTLLEGLVKVSTASSSKMLFPGKELEVNKKGNIKVVEADIEEVMAWKNGWFKFNSFGIEKVMRQISRWYDVEIVYEGKIPAGHFSGSISRENDISQVLKILKAGGLNFRIEGRKLIVFS